MTTATKYRAGDVLSEQEVAQRIITTVTEIIASDVDATIRLHDLVCKGEITVYEDKDGNALDAGGEPIREPESEPWIYTFTRGEDEEVVHGEPDAISDTQLELLVSTQVQRLSPETVNRAIRAFAKSRGVL